MSINSQNPANVLIFNFDEKGNEYNNNYNIENFLTDINKKPNIIFICTQNSISRTDKHLQHIIGKKLPENYKRFSKIDATRQSNLKKIIYKNLKNVRTRIYYNTEKVYVDDVFKRFSNQSYKKRSIFNFSNNSIDENEEKYTISKTNNKPIIIKEYKYRIYTVKGENGRTGLGGIMTSIIFEINGIEYQYIICNFNFNSKNIQSNFNKLIKIENIQLHSMNITGKGNLKETTRLLQQKILKENSSSMKTPIYFIYFISKNNIKYGKYFDENKYDIIKLNGKKNNDKPNKYFPKNIVISSQNPVIENIVIPSSNLYFENTENKKNMIKKSLQKKVLVLCQRKPGNENSKNYKKLIEIETKINNLVTNLIGPDSKIEYLTPGIGNEKFEANYKFILTKNISYINNFNKTKQFIKNNNYSYDLIILNTCPFYYINYEIIYELLKPNGIMIYTSYPLDITKLSKLTVPENLSNFFENINELERFNTLNPPINDGFFYKKILK